jgi:hypothetical protein
MARSLKHERQLLSADELSLVEKTHHPALGLLPGFAELRNSCASGGTARKRSLRQRRELRGKAFQAGNGVHIPVFAPHWVRNHDNISVAVSVNYELRSAQSEKRIRQVNRLMRKLGIASAAPGESPWRDRVKLAAADSLMMARNLIKPKPATYPTWRPSSV